MKLMEKLRARKDDNKGFSLVELIIVIAIMAILIGIVGANVVPWIENSRVAKDAQILSGLLTDGVAAFSQNAGQMQGSNTYTITWKKDGTPALTVTGGTGTDGIETTFRSLHNASSVGTLGFSSKAADNIDVITIEMDPGTKKTTLKVYKDSVASANDITIKFGTFESL